jgi:hypothetical protein
LIGKMLEFLFGCHHRVITRPITPVYKHQSKPSCAYVTCLECGKQFHYDTKNMCVGTPLPLSLTGTPGSGSYQTQY